MSPVAPNLRQFARRLLALEAAAPEASGSSDFAALRVCEKLRRHLTRLTGVAGFRSILGRVLALACDEAPWVTSLKVAPDGGLKGLEEIQAKVSRSALNQGGVILIAHLIGLLVTFIGEALTFNLVQEAWPDISKGDLKLLRGGRP